MSSFSFLFLCIQACLIQNAFSQFLNYGRGGYTGLEVEVDAVSSAAAGLSGYGGPGLGYGNALGFGGANIGLAGVNNLGLGLGNANLGLGGLNAVGLNNANIGLNGLGLVNAGSVGTGFAGGYGYGVPDVTATASLPVTGPYGGTGYGELAVGGDIGAVGTAIVTGQIPALGSVSFGGNVLSSGVVSIAGSCPCGGVLL